MTLRQKVAPTTSPLTSVVPVIIIATLTAMAGLLALFAGIRWLGSLDYVDNEYANRAEAEAHHLFGPGWMPEDMPATMNDIHTRLDIDVNLAWATFITDEAGAEEIRARYTSISADSVPLPGDSGAFWWPRDLPGERRIRKADFEFYQCGEGTGYRDPAYLALDPKTHRVYYWLR